MPGDHGGLREPGARASVRDPPRVLPRPVELGRGSPAPEPHGLARRALSADAPGSRGDARAPAPRPPGHADGLPVPPAPATAPPRVPAGPQPADELRNRGRPCPPPRRVT